ncbi:MAG: DedA family protein [Proteobacteria bacterium]|nr:DedA family protein [Pseudomonadota bacterium]
MIKRFYKWIMDGASKPHATWIVSIISFAESSFFPLPPDLLIIPMVLAQRHLAWRLAWLCTLTSVIGGIVGYGIGYFMFETLGEWIINTYNLHSAFEKFQIEFHHWGFWIIALKGLTPIPYKLVTIASGVAQLDMKTFLIASIIARGFRFYLLSFLLWFFGPWAKDFIEKYLNLVLILSLAIIVLGFLIVKWLV